MEPSSKISGQPDPAEDSVLRPPPSTSTPLSTGDGAQPSQGTPVLLSELEKNGIEGPSLTPVLSPEGTSPTRSGDVESQKPKAASWKILEPAEPWCPSELRGILGFEHEAKNNHSEHAKSVDEWVVTAATKRGRMHAHHGDHREDAFHWIQKKCFAFYCVCDGAGSAKLSRIGSEFAARCLCDQVASELLEKHDSIQSCAEVSLQTNLKNILHHAVSVTAQRLREMAGKVNRSANDFRCTLLTALQYKHPSGDYFVFGSVGDGFVAIKDSKGGAKRISISDSGEFSGEVLCFMPDSAVGDFYRKSIDALQIFKAADISDVLLCTDGIEDPFFPVEKNIGEIFRQLEEGYAGELNGVSYAPHTQPASVLDAADPSAELLNWLHFEKRGENDDRTVLWIRKTGDRTPVNLFELQKKTPESIAIPPAEEDVGHDKSGPKFEGYHRVTLFLLVTIGVLVGVIIGLVVGFQLQSIKRFDKKIGGSSDPIPRESLTVIGAF